jgi:hypothetical protein
MHLMTKPGNSRCLLKSNEFIIGIKEKIMKSPKSLLLIFLIALSAFFIGFDANAQEGVPKEVLSIIDMKLEDGQAKLNKLGYEICSSSFMGKKQDWYNESTKNCLTVHFNKSKSITEVVLNLAISDCQKGLEASRKIWENYHDGQAPVNSEKINAERKKLTDQGFKPSYWIYDVSPGRNAEYWINETTKKVKVIVWEIQGEKWVMTNESDYKMGKNPAPSKK